VQASIRLGAAASPAHRVHDVIAHLDRLVRCLPSMSASVSGCDGFGWKRAWTQRAARSCHAYSNAFYIENVWLWQVPGAQHLAAPVMLIAFLLAVVGMRSRNPTSVGQEGTFTRDPEARGIQRITRHPFLCGVVLWSALHASINGDVASLVLFTTFLVVALIGMRSIDRKRERALGDAWARYPLPGMG
jgi:hypothetical protein